MFKPFGEKHLSEIDRKDIEALINDQVPEGLLVEYKRDWTSTKVARAVASFANSQGGGWLIVGMEAAKLLPTKIAALQDTGDLEERVVQTIRSSVAPVPALTLRAVQIDPGTACLVVHVPEGTSRRMSSFVPGSCWSEPPLVRNLWASTTARHSTDCSREASVAASGRGSKPRLCAAPSGIPRAPASSPSLLSIRD